MIKAVFMGGFWPIENCFLLSFIITANIFVSNSETTLPTDCIINLPKNKIK